MKISKTSKGTRSSPAGHRPDLQAAYARVDAGHCRQGEEGRPRGETVAQAVTFAAEQFLQAESWESVIDDVLGRLGPAMGADRVYLFQNEDGDTDGDASRQRHEWVAEGVQAHLHDSGFRYAEWKENGFRRWSSRLGQGHVVQGTLSEFPPKERQMLERIGVRATIAVPVFVGNAWWGGIGFSDCRRERIWSTMEVDALRLAASTLGAAIARRRTEEQLRRRNRELTLLNRVIAAATSTLETDTVLEKTCRELAQAFHLPQAGAALLDESGLGLEVVAEYISDEASSALGARIPVVDNPASQYVLEQKEPLVIDDVQSDPRMAPVRALMEQRGVASMLLLPLVVDGQAVGTLGLDAKEARRFSDEEITLAFNAVSAASQVLEKARLLTAEQENAARLARIMALSTEMASIRDEERLLQTVVERASGLAGSCTCTVSLVDEATEEVVLRAQSGLGDDALGLRVPMNLSWMKKAIVAQKPLIVPDIDRVAPDLRQWLVRPDVQSFYAYPLVGQDGALGYITLSGLQAREPSPAEVNALRLLAERLAAALQNVRLLSAVRSQAVQLSTLNEVDKAITTSLEPEEVYATIVQSAADLLHCEVVNLYRWEPEADAFEGLASYGLGPGDSVSNVRFQAAEDPLIRAVVRAGQTVPVVDARRDERVLPAWLERVGMQAVLAVPLLYHEQLTGFLIFNDTQCKRDWSPQEMALAESLAAQAAIAVANARLHAQTRRLLEQSRQQARIMKQIVETVPEGLLLLGADRSLVLANPVGQEFLRALNGTVPDSGAPLEHLGDKPLVTLLSLPPEGQSFHEVVVEEPQRRIFEVAARAMEAGPQAGGWVMVVREATQEREQQAYLQAQDRLATVGQLAAGIAHDFNNIMSVIVLYAQALQRIDVSARNKERLAAIYQQAQRASSLIGQILDFSRRSVVERQSMDLVPFLKEVVRLLERTLPETIGLKLVHDDEEYVVNVDPTRLQQALMNLALNARDAMPSGGTLTVEVRRYGTSWEPPLPDMRQGQWIYLSVSDSGTGIPTHVLPHVFEPFFTTKGPGQGTGLGLAQVYGIVKQNEGFIDVESTPGKGTKFHIYLPAFSLPTVQDELPEKVTRLANGEVILVVEDEPSIRSAISETLEQYNYTVLVAADGEEALRIYDERREEIALVLSDMVMPRLDGAGLFRALRSRNPQLKMIVFTGYPLDEEGRAFVEESGLTWIQKPFNGDEIADLMQAALAE